MNLKKINIDSGAGTIGITSINVDNSTFGSVENNNQMIATGNLSITNALTGNGTLTMNGATLQVKDGFATSNNLVSNNMQFGEDIKTIEVAKNNDFIGSF